MFSPQLDIVGELPAELSQKALKYLDIGTLTTSRRVSKSWKNILSSENFCKLMCKSVFDTFVDDEDGTICWNDRFLQNASRSYAVGYGRPWAKAHHSCRQTEEMPPKVGYGDGLLAWYEQGGFRILDLESGERTEHWSDSYEPPKALKVVKEFLVWYDLRQFRAFSFSTRQSSNLELPRNPELNRMAWDVCQNIVMFTQPTPISGLIEVTTWKLFEEGQSSAVVQGNKSFTVRLPSDYDSCSIAFKNSSQTGIIDLIVNDRSSTRMIKLFEDGTFKVDWTQDSLSRGWTYDYESNWEEGMTTTLIKSVVECFNNSPHGLLPPIPPTMKHILLTRPVEHVMFWAIPNLFSHPPKPTVLQSLIFGHDSTIDEEQEYVVRRMMPVTADTLYLPFITSLAPVESLKNISIIHQSRDKVSRLRSNFHYDDSRFPSGHESNAHVKWTENRDSMAQHVHCMFLDQRYLILASLTDFEIYAFDKDAVLVGELKDYREGRVVRMRERLARKREKET